MKIQKTNRIFYGKYPYKISCYAQGSYLIRYYQCVGVLRICAGKEPRPYFFTEFLNQQDRVINLINFTNAFTPYEKSVKSRYEASSVDFYHNNGLEFHRNFVNDLSNWIIEITEPSSEEELNFLNSNTNKKILRDSLPHKEYQYRIYLDYKLDLNTREQFYKWIQNYKSKVKFPPNTEKWLSGCWGWAPIIYVKDSGTLSLLSLFLGKSLLKTEEFVLRSSINNANI